MGNFLSVFKVSSLFLAFDNEQALILGLVRLVVVSSYSQTALDSFLTELGIMIS